MGKVQIIFLYLYFSALVHMRPRNPGILSNTIANPNITKFTLVRHPFERLVSAYRDKFEKCDVVGLKRQFINTFKKGILQAGRRNITSEQFEETCITFEDFVVYLLKLPLKKYDQHWLPYWRACNPCKIKYDLIGKLENVEKYMEELNSLIQYKSFMNLTKQHSTGSNDDLVKEYMDMLTQEQREGLYNIYKLDFILFNYNYDLK